MDGAICPICGSDKAACGTGATHYTPLGAGILARPRLSDRRTAVADFVRIEVKPGDVRKVAAEDAEKFIEANPGATQVGDEPAMESAAGPDDPSVPYDAGSDENADKPAKSPSQAKAQKPVEDK